MKVNARGIRRTQIFILGMECHGMKTSSKERNLARLMVGAILFSGGTLFSPVASAEVSVTSKAEADALAANGTMVKGGAGQITAYYLNPAKDEKMLSVSGRYSYNTTGSDTLFYASYKDPGSASGYTLTVEKGAVFDNFWFCNLAGAYMENGDAVGNQLILRDGTVSVGGVIAGGVSADGNATGNAVTIDNASLSTGGMSPMRVIGGQASNNATDNTVTVNGGNVGAEIIGGRSTASGDANRNTVNITGGTMHTTSITGGVATEGNVTGNTVNLIGGNLTGSIVTGGTIGSGQATDNTVNVFSTFNLGGLHGGVVSSEGTSSGNTLNLFAEKVETAKMDSFQTINFYLPGTVKDGSTMLSVQNVVNLSGMTIGVGAEPGVSLEKGDTVFLILSGGGIAGENIKTRNLNTNPIAEDLDTDSVYTFLIKQEDLNTLVATVEGETEIEVPERTKSVVETKAATLTILNSGADMLAGKGFDQAANAVTLAAAEHERNGGADAQKRGGFTPFAAFGGGSLRAESGSHVDTKGFGSTLGFARELSNTQGNLLFGPVVEYGGGSYDSYLDNGVHGEGGSHYWGFGLIARQTNHNGFYYEGSVRGGRVTSDYKGNLKRIGEVRYDSGTNYWAAHLGVGKAFRVDAKNTLDGYLKYFYSHQAGEDITVQFQGVQMDGRVRFDSLDSHRIRLGTRLTHKVNEKNRFYCGLAYQYEFGGDARAHYGGNMTPSPSVKGSSGMMEIGWQVKPGVTPVTIDLGVTGWFGKQRGVTAGLQAMWSL